MLAFVVDLLQCPHCQGILAWTITERDGERIEEAEARCRGCGANYPVREGIGLFLTPDLPRDDLWQQAESGLMRLLREQPEIERRLLDVPLEALGAADLLFRALALEERDQFAEAKAAADRAWLGLYTEEYRACHERQRVYLVNQLRETHAPIVDLASGRGDLVERFARELRVPVVGSDFSPRVLRRDRRWLQYWGLYERVSLLAFDARRIPFRDGAVATMTSNLGLPNVDEPAKMLPELGRVVAGKLLAISQFYPDDAGANAAAIREQGRGAMFFRAEAQAAFRAAGWQVDLANRCAGRALPTPMGVVIEGAGIDGMPVAETTLEWGVLVARKRSRRWRLWRRV